MRPGDFMVDQRKSLHERIAREVYSCSSLNDDGILTTQFLNTSKQEIEVNLQIGQQFATIILPANSLQTVRVAGEFQFDVNMSLL